MSLWQSYLTLQPKYKFLIGAGMIGYATFGLFLSDEAEKRFGYTPSEKDREELRGVIPKIRVVDE